MANRIKLRADQFSALCKFSRHDLDPQELQVFIERAMFLGVVWVGYNTCKVCGTKRVDVMSEGGKKKYYSRYYHPDEYDTTMTADEARRIIVTAALKATAQPERVTHQ